MNRAKKSNNIFNKPILPESLFYEEVQKDYKIGGVKVQGCWLQNSPAPIYKTSIKSAIQLAQLRAQYEQLKQNAIENPTDMFRMAEIKKRIQNFQLIDQSPRKKRDMENLNVKQQNLMLQKLTKFWGIYQRKCKIIGKQLIFQSQKQKKQKTIYLKDYIISLQQKQNNTKNHQQFIWPQNYNFRLFLQSQTQRPYCVYGEQKALRNILKKIKIEAIEVKEFDKFKLLSKNFEQKMMILFGNKLRIYEHLLKQKQTNDLNIAFELLQKSHLLDDMVNDSENQKKKVEKQSPNVLNDDAMQSQSQPSVILSNKKSLNKEQSQILSTPTMRSPLSLSQSQFRMRARRSTINYQDIQNEDEVYDIKLGDFKLQIKQVTHSSDEQAEVKQQITKEQQQISKIMNIQGRDQLKKKGNENNRKLLQQLTIHENPYEDSNISDSISQKENQQQFSFEPIPKPKLKLQSKPKQQQQSLFDYKPIPMSHEIYIAYFQPFYPCGSHQLHFAFFQQRIPDVEFQGMKLPVCCAKKIMFKLNQNTNFFESEQPIIIPISKWGQKIGIYYNNQITQTKHQFEADVKKIVYAVDKSQLLYFKYDNKIQCAGKLKLIISPTKIQPSEFKQESTEEFLMEWLHKKQNNKQDKYRFLDYKKRHAYICQKWNNKMIKRIVNRVDEKEFQKAIFYGIPDKILQKMGNILKTRSSMTMSMSRTETLFEKSSTGNSFFTPQCYAMLEYELVKMRVYDLRMFIKMEKLSELIVNGKKNQQLQKRINDIGMYFSIKYGRNEVEKFMAAYVIQTLRKVEPVLMTLKNAKQIQLFFNEYFEVEYEINEIMEGVCAYFN